MAASPRPRAEIASSSREFATGRPLALLSDPELAARNNGQPLADLDAVMSVAFASDELLATGGFRTVRLWRRATRSVRRDFGALPEPATVLAISPNGEWAAAGGRQWAPFRYGRCAPRVRAHRAREHAAPIAALAFSPDSTTLVSAAEDKAIRFGMSPAGTSKPKPKLRRRSALSHFPRMAQNCSPPAQMVCASVLAEELPAELPPPVREFKQAGTSAASARND
jgi:hypothetical protein